MQSAHFCCYWNWSLFIVNCIHWFASQEHMFGLLKVGECFESLRNLKWFCVLVLERGCTNESEHQKTTFLHGPSSRMGTGNPSVLLISKRSKVYIDQQQLQWTVSCFTPFGWIDHGYSRWVKLVSSILTSARVAVHPDYQNSGTLKLL